jgi:hypothetical protein
MAAHGAKLPMQADLVAVGTELRETPERATGACSRHRADNGEIEENVAPVPLLPAEP